MKDQLPIVLAAITALCWGLAPVFGKLGVDRADPLVALTWRTLIIAALLVPVLLVTRGPSALASVPPRSILLIGAEGVLAALVGQLLYYWALKIGSPAVVTPVAAAFPLVTVVATAAIFALRLSWQHGLGAALIVAGVLVLQFAPKAA